MTEVLPQPAADERAHAERLVALIADEIRTHGPLPFARYMERCLYAPGLGYYSAGRHKFGADGDFVTAPELGSLFARTIAHALAPSLQALGGDADFVELGAGSGAFAVDVLAELATLEALPRRYRILEPSADLADRQAHRVRESLPASIASRVEWLAVPPASAWHGVLFANEVVDALPVARFVMREDGVGEECVVLEGDRLVLVERDAHVSVTTAVRHVEHELGIAFAAGYRSEILPQLPAWFAAITARQQRGVALFIDYGYPRREFYLPERHRGTLVCHYRHRAHTDVLAWPGQSDISAFVDFSALAEAGIAAGFDLVGYTTQAQFLIAHGLATLVDAETRTRARLRLVNAAKRLTLPGEMGERFQAIAFARDVDDALPALRAFDRSRHL